MALGCFGNVLPAYLYRRELISGGPTRTRTWNQSIMRFHREAPGRETHLKAAWPELAEEARADQNGLDAKAFSFG
jgi:hypothetical protein